MLKKAGFLVVVCLIATPSFSADRFVDVTARVSWVDISGGEQGEDIGIDFDSQNIGYGLGANFFLSNRVSLEIAAAAVEPEVVFVDFSTDAPIFTTGLQIIPVTAGLQFHISPHKRFDPYVGAGVGNVFFGEVEDLGDIDNKVGGVELDDDLGFMVNAGFNYGFGKLLALNVDARYIDVDADIHVLNRQGTAFSIDPVELNPVFVSAGLSLRF